MFSEDRPYIDQEITDIVGTALVSPGDLVLFDRNNHKSSSRQDFRSHPISIKRTRILKDRKDIWDTNDLTTLIVHIQAQARFILYLLHWM